MREGVRDECVCVVCVCLSVSPLHTLHTTRYTLHTTLMAHLSVGSITTAVRLCVRQRSSARHSA